MEGITYYPGWTEENVSPSDIYWNQPVIRWDSKTQRELIGRPSQGYGDAPFSYAGKHMDPLRWNANQKILEIKHDLEMFTGESFYFCLCGLYQDNSVAIPHHSDEIEDDDDIIASVSFGHSRIFSVKDITADALPEKHYLLHHGDLMIMNGRSQRTTTHAVPAMETPCGPRVNLTFRTKGSFK